MRVNDSAVKPSTDSIPAPSPARSAQRDICRIEGPVETLSWDAIEKQNLGTSRLHQYLIPYNDDESSPLLIKGVVQHWPALQKWSLEWLAEHFPEQRAAVRISPSLRFTYVEQKLMPLYLLLSRPEQAPSMLAPAMSLRELGDRMGPDCRLPSLVYPGQEHYYMQSPLWPGIMPDVDMNGPPFSCLMDPDDVRLQGLVERQVPRMWLSPKGAISPLHYDSHMSILTQVKGRKRLLLYRPQDLRVLQPYPAWHILRRRCRVDPANPDYKRFPAFQKVAALEALLQPGDSLIFPAKWAHHTESLDSSISVTYRLGPARPATARLAGVLRPYTACHSVVRCLVA